MIQLYSLEMTEKLFCHKKNCMRSMYGFCLNKCHGF